VKFIANFDKEAIGLRENETQLFEKLKKAEVVLGGDTAAKYRRLVEAHGSEALAAVEGGVCTGCYVSLTSQQRVQLNSGQILFCSSCGRLMYLPQTAS
jgi:predicted  nucleic acid-binding Zn-ribbon protein